jgi:hypothetical protein
MYELILKWGVENLSKFSAIKGEHELALIKEAIATKNSLAIRKYGDTVTNFNMLVDAIFEIEKSLELENARYTDLIRNEKDFRTFLHDFNSKVRSPIVNRISVLMLKFGYSNELISAYSHAFFKLFSGETLTELCKTHNITTKGGVFRVFKASLRMYMHVISSVIRVCSLDLRFWITDYSYIKFADKWSARDVVKSKKYLFTDKKFYLSLESREGLERFWLDFNSI